MSLSARMHIERTNHRHDNEQHPDEPGEDTGFEIRSSFRYEQNLEEFDSIGLKHPRNQLEFTHPHSHKSQMHLIGQIWALSIPKPSDMVNT